MSKLSLAVIGAGHLGRIHARLLANGEHAELTAIVDPVEAARQALAEQHQVQACSTWQDLQGQIDAAVIAAPTIHHADLALGLIEAGIHVLVEKPLAFSAREAEAIVEAAAENDIVVQSGHCERFNPAFQAIMARNLTPQLIEANRCGPYSFRSTDIGVVFDLMIHDIDLALAMVDADVMRVDAVGGIVIGPHEDWAQARLEFTNGTVAQLSACRTEIDAARTLKVRGQGLFAEADLASGELRLLTPGQPIQTGFDPNQLSMEERDAWKTKLFEELLIREDIAGEGNAILEEQKDFLQAVESRREPFASGRCAAQAVAIAERVLHGIRNSQQQPPLRRAG